MENLDIFYEAFELFKSKTVLDVDTSRFKKFYSSFKGEKYEDIQRDGLERRPEKILFFRHPAVRSFFV